MDNVVEKEGLKKKLSINGETVTVTGDFNQVSIHDYAVFEHQEQLRGEYFDTIRRPSTDEQTVSSNSQEPIPSASQSADRKLIRESSFSKAVRTVMRCNNVLSLLKKYDHRSDTEPDSDDSDESEVKEEAIQPSVILQEQVEQKELRFQAEEGTVKELDHDRVRLCEEFVSKTDDKVNEHR